MPGGRTIAIAERVLGSPLCSDSGVSIVSSVSYTREGFHAPFLGVNRVNRRYPKLQADLSIWAITWRGHGALFSLVSVLRGAVRGQHLSTYGVSRPDRGPPAKRLERLFLGLHRLHRCNSRGCNIPRICDKK